MKIYYVSMRHYYAFGALISEELSYKLRDLDKVRWMLPNSYLNAKNKDYGGEPFINGQYVPYDPKYHDEWVRNDTIQRERVKQNLQDLRSDNMGEGLQNLDERSPDIGVPQYMGEESSNPGGSQNMGGGPQNMEQMPQNNIRGMSQGNMGGMLQSNMGEVLQINLGGALNIGTPSNYMMGEECHQSRDPKIFHQERCIRMKAFLTILCQDQPAKTRTTTHQISLLMITLARLKIFLLREIINEHNVEFDDMGLIY
ncbi:hypothetical protein POM88_017447 [Heracleum sosnowskyi]|uniref:MORF/ORRM1/DAG-like MORF domain-containing protein n=1 Tax=Heracleum sosnowskyi TaxID=360622 RepID=A0AAD8MXY8_9APIA|nr:hypothetical protein POM88_017447 [Heracleum sosnowskyi]